MPSEVSGAAVGGGRGVGVAVCCGAGGCGGVLQDRGGCTCTGPGHAFRAWGVDQPVPDAPHPTIGPH